VEVGNCKALQLYPPYMYLQVGTDCEYPFLYQIGKTKVFLRAGQMAELDARRAEVLSNAVRLIQRRIRTHLMRKDFISLKKASIQTQKFWRGIHSFAFSTSCLGYKYLFSSDLTLTYTLLKWCSTTS
jgi:hypothetical protein